MASSDVYEDKPQVGVWRKFLIEMSREMRDEDLQRAKVAARDNIGSKGFEEITNALTFFETLERNGLIGEDNTDYLKQIFESIHLNTVLKELNEYKELRKEYLKKRGEIMCRRPGAVFVGREEYLEEVITKLKSESDRITCVSICGLAGMGKTELALEVCSRMDYRAYHVSLREKKSLQEVLLEMLTSLGVNVTFDTADFVMLKDWCASCKIDTILFIDNADKVMEPESRVCDDFHNILLELLRTKNKRLKIIMTSRYAFSEVRFGHVAFKQIELKPFEIYESINLLQKLASISYEEATELATLTGNLPLALRIIASRLKDGGVLPRDIIMQLDPVKQRTMKTLDYPVHEELKSTFSESPVDQCLQLVFEALPDALKNAWLKLSVFPSTFDELAAHGVLGEEELSAAKIDILQPLVSLWKVVQAETNVSFENLKNYKAVAKYSLHPLVRSFLQEIPKEKKLQNSVKQAERNYVNFYDQLLRQNAKKVEKNYTEVMKFMVQNNQTNLDYYVELMMQLKMNPALESKKDHKMALSLFLMYEYYLDPDRRIEIFDNFAQSYKERGSQVEYCFMRAFEADSYIPKAYHNVAKQKLQEPFQILKSLEKDAVSSTEMYKLTLATCEYVQARCLVWEKGQRAAIKLYEKSLAVRTQLLKNHTYVARTLNAIGHAYYSLDEFNDSAKYHKEAVDVLSSVAKDGPHLDMPIFLTNVGTCCHAMGNSAADRKDTEESERKYYEALSYYDKALQIEKSMNLYGYSKTAVCLKNKALTYSEMKKYDEALTLAHDAMDIRKRLLGDNHPDTARSVYFVGSLYQSLAKEAKDKGKKTGNAEDREKSFSLYKKAMEFYKRAAEIEVSLEPERRSCNYPDVKKNIEIVLKALGRNNEISQYKALFLEATTKKIATKSDNSSCSSSSSASDPDSSSDEK